MDEQVGRPNGAYITRREIDIMKAEADRARDDMRRRMDQMDNQGTRGVIGLTVQFGELQKDIGGIVSRMDAHDRVHEREEQKIDSLRADMENRFKDHEERHRQDHREHVRGRRWVIGTGIAAIVALCAVITLLALLLHQVH